MVSSVIPEPGQLVEVRQRRFVVTEIQRSALPADMSGHNVNDLQHLITLSSVEDDALGEELQVVWELELGAHVFNKANLPELTGYDDPARLDAFLNAVRWGAISSADVRALQSPFRSGIEIEDYQLDPIVRALKMPRVNLLVADDVGLGKTVEAGLVVQELLLRYRARTMLVVCPAHLQIHWRDQMREKFGLEFRIVDSAMMKDLRRRRGLHVNPWKHFPRLITSMAFLRRDRQMRLFREVLPAEGEPAFPRQFDLLIVDEAHNIAPSGSGHYAMDSLQTAAIRTIAPHFEHKLFLTATPHNGYPESFTALLELLDNQRFARAVKPDPKQLETIMVRRLKRDLPPNWDGTPRFPERTIEPIEVAYTDAERNAHQALRRYAELRQKAASDEIGTYAVEFVLKLLKKRLISSPAAFALTLEKHLKSISSGQKKAHARAIGSNLGILRKRIEQVEDDFDDDAAFEEQTEEVIDNAAVLFDNLSAEERSLLEELQKYANANSVRADSKAERFIEWLHENIKPNAQWSDNRVLIFTEYRATQAWLHTLLASECLADGDRLMEIYGGMEPDKREKIKAAFQADPSVSPVRILLATDAASEGIDLQNHCHQLIHYEIPWNPNRMEQRNGRLDRHGQKHDVQIYHFVGKGYAQNSVNSTTRPGDLEGDLEFLMRVAQKVENIREDLGKVGPVIATQVQEAMLGRRTTLDTAKTEREAEKPRKMLKFERNLRDEIQKLHEQLQETKIELQLSPENTQAVVEIGLQLADQPSLIEASLPGIWPDPTGKRKSCPVFYLPPLKGSWAECSVGLAHPHSGAIRPIVFDHTIAGGRDDVVLVHLNHRLAQMCLRLLRAEVWSRDNQKRLHRVAVKIVPNSILETPAVIAHGRLVVLGGDNRRLHEELIESGGYIREGRFSRMNVADVQRVLSSTVPIDAPDSLKQQLTDLWPKLVSPLYNSLESRMRDKTATLFSRLEERASKEADDITHILNELQRNISEQLNEAAPEQLELWTDPEKDQLERNRQSLRLRLEQIPGEITRETQAIQDRYANPTPRLFPVAVTFLVPEKLARSAGGSD
ncbi:MAG: DISARM system SNF2-like helicase DrmD [Armatimonadetes bacterium]|nr:DISARM system SNF2-like helicase DrmD [Armatimonadota bacterium]